MAMKDEQIRTRSKKKLIRVTFPDGEVICYNNATSTMIAALNKIGSDKFPAINLELCHLPLLSKEIYPQYKEWMKPVSNGWYLQGEREQHLWKRVQVASIMSLLTERNYYNTLRLKFDYIIVDEAHHSLADTYIKLFELFPEAKKLGVTATPWRLNHESLAYIATYIIPILSEAYSCFVDCFSIFLIILKSASNLQ